MTGVERRILILAGRLSRHDARWPLAPWLDRLERRGWRPQVVCLSRGNVLGDDPRCIERPALGNRWVGSWSARTFWSRGTLPVPDLMHVIHDDMSETALVLAESAGIPYIQTVADFRTLTRGLRLSRDWCRHLVAIAPDLATGLVEELGVPGPRIVVIPPGISLPTEPAREAVADRVPVIGAGGPGDEVSGLMVFLEAARRILDSGRDAEFVIAGQGASQVELRRRAQALRITERVTVVEFPSLGADYWSVVDLYCQPSVTANAGVSLLQAMAYAVPCIATTAHGVRGIIEPGTSGLVIPPGDPRALELAITYLLESPEQARQLGQNARRRIHSQFDPEVEADRLAALYSNALRIDDEPRSSSS